LKALGRRAAAAGFGQQFLDALKTLERALRIYPQVGEPLQDLPVAGETIYHATFQPLVVQYVVDEARREVYILVPIKVLPDAGFR
jgi:hypothetical protein